MPWSSTPIIVLVMVLLRATMARQALASGSPGNNPRVPTEAEIIDLYETVWNQE